MLLSPFIPLSFLPSACVCKSVLYVCVSIAALQIGSTTILLDSIYMGQSYEAEELVS